jgi:O-antigen/teichoic acid export membrane protein
LSNFKILNVSKIIVIQAIVFLLVLLSYKLAFNKLGSEAFGIFTFSLMLGALLTSLVDLGISKVVSKEIASSKNLTEVEGLIKSFNLIYFLAMVVVGLLLPLTAAFFIEDWLSIKESSSVDSLVNFLEVLLIANCLFLPLQYLNGIVVGLGSSRLLQMHSFIVPFINYIVWVIGFLLFDELKTIGFIIILGKFLSLLVSVFCILFMSKLNILKFGFDFNLLKKIKNSIFNLTISSVCIIIIKSLDRTLASSMLQIETYGIYDVISQIFGRISIFLNSTFSVYFKSMVIESEQTLQKFNGFFSFKDWINKYLIAIYLFPALFANEIIIFLFSEEHIEEFYLVVIVLSLAYFINSQTRVLSTYAIIFNQSIVVRKNSISLLFLSLLFIPVIYWFGLIGFAVFVLLVQIASYINFQYLFSRYIFKTSFIQTLYENILVIFLYISLLIFVSYYEHDLFTRIILLGVSVAYIILLEIYKKTIKNG